MSLKRSKAGNVWDGKKHVASDIGGRDHKKARKAAIGGLSGFFANIFGGLSDKPVRTKKFTSEGGRTYKRKGKKRRALVASKVGIVYKKTSRGAKKVGRCRRRGRRWIK